MQTSEFKCCHLNKCRSHNNEITNIVATVKSHRHAFLPATKVWPTIFKMLSETTFTVSGKCMEQCLECIHSLWASCSWTWWWWTCEKWQQKPLWVNVKTSLTSCFPKQNKAGHTHTHTCCWQPIDAQNSSMVLTLSCVGWGSHGCTSCKDRKNLLDNNPLCHAKETKLNAIDQAPSLLPHHFFSVVHPNCFLWVCDEVPVRHCLHVERCQWDSSHKCWGLTTSVASWQMAACNLQQWKLSVCQSAEIYHCAFGCQVQKIITTTY